MKERAIKYRPDIDGLRTVAVLSVLVYHFNKSWLPGGFVGVDVFFAISGYLITGIVVSKSHAKDFSLGDFYYRRARRILPAVLFVSICTMLVGMIFMLPDDLDSLSASVIATLLSLANVYFWLFLDTEYFADSSDMVPLLHMWSLGVEEQFYLLWPVFLIIFLKLFGKQVALLVACCLAMVSFYAGELLVSDHPEFSYYMLPTRAGGLLLGCITYMSVEIYRPRLKRVIAEIISIVGMAMIGYSLWYVEQANGFPGWVAAIPAAGASLVILSGVGGITFVTRLLSTKAMVSIGLISFSLYLWHWPVLAFFRYGYGELNIAGGLICLALILLFSLLSYHFVEKKFRYGHGGMSIKAVLAAMVGLLLISSTVKASNGDVGGLFGSRYAEELQGMEQLTKAAYSFPYNCQTSRWSDALAEDPRCVMGKEGQAPSVLVFGDSNAAHYVGYLKSVSEHYGFSVRNISHSSCPPLFDSAHQFVKLNIESCRAFNEFVKSRLGEYGAVIVGASWLGYRGAGYEDAISESVRQLSESVEEVVILLNVPRFPGYDRKCDQKALRIPFLDCEERGRRLDNGDYPINDYIKAVASQHENVMTFSIRDIVCQEGWCSSHFSGRPAYFDGGHLSMLGSEAMGRYAIENGLVPEFFVRMEGD